MASDWENTLQNRMKKFEIRHSANLDDISISVKVRVDSGCFHREHSPHAYKIIDEYLQNIPPEEYSFGFEEHESGPEILVYLALASSLITLSGNIIDLIATIIKARSESVKKGDHPRAPIELIVRRSTKSGKIREEKVLRMNYDDYVDYQEMGHKLNQAVNKLLSDSESKRRKK
jgi:hypothetical protein